MANSHYSPGGEAFRRCWMAVRMTQLSCSSWVAASSSEMPQTCATMNFARSRSLRLVGFIEVMKLPVTWPVLTIAMVESMFSVIFCGGLGGVSLLLQAGELLRAGDIRLGGLRGLRLGAGRFILGPVRFPSLGLQRR